MVEIVFSNFVYLLQSVVVADLDQAAGQATEKEFSKQFGRDAVKFVRCDVTNDDDLTGKTSMFQSQKKHCYNNIPINMYTFVLRCGIVQGPFY